MSSHSDDETTSLTYKDISSSNSPSSYSILNNCIDNNKYDILYAIILALGNAADAVEIMCIGYIMNEIDDITTSQKEFLSAAVFLGMLFGGLLCGLLSDKIGRKPCLQYSLLINTIASIASAFAPSITWLIFCRVIGGIGIGGSVPSVFTLGAELFPSKIRGKLLSVIASFWMVGAIYVGLVGWIMLGNDFNGNRIIPGIGWRLFALICAIPVVAALLLTTYIVPESPHYLIGKAKFKKAADILTKISDIPVSVNQLELLYSSSRLQDTKNNNISESETESFLIDFKSILVLFSENLYKSTLLYMVIWFTLCFGSYGLSTWISVLFEDIEMNNVYLNSFIFTLANLPGNIVSIFFIEKVGRKKMLAYGMIAAAISALGFGFGKNYPAIVITSASLFNGFSVIGWNALDCISVENFPTNIRTTAMGLLAAAGRLGAISAQFVNGTLESNIAVLLFVTSGCMFVGGFSSLYAPIDTTGKSIGDQD